MKLLDRTPRRLAQRAKTPIDYPESDGKPMGETDEHRNLMVYLIEVLKEWFRTKTATYVSGNLMMYYVEDRPRKCVSPDVFVVKGVPKHDRRVYKLWEERRAPAVVIEVSSRKTKHQDLVVKFALYRDVLKVREYYLYDPRREYLSQRLRAWELRGDEYVERTVRHDRIRSSELGLDLEDRGGSLRLVDPATARDLPSLAESEEARRRAEEERRRAEDERRRAEDERRREASARAAAQREVRRLRQELRRLRRKS